MSASQGQGQGQGQNEGQNTEQANQQLTATPVNPGNPPLQSNTANSNDPNSIRCQWINCGEYHTSAEALYDQRKSTNNLNLQCAWANCNVQVVKRDHITSHIRVHVPLKPHRCQFCGKTFKRPQDLKKHVKTHADDTVLNGIPQSASRDNHPHQNGGFNMGNQPKGPSYYPEHHMQPHPPMGYGGPQGHNGAPNYYAPTQQQGYGNGYGTVSYSLGPGGGVSNASLDSTKSIADLNAFIGDLQRGLVNTKSYNQVSNRLMPLQQSGVPYILGGGMADYHTAPAQIDVGGGHGTAYASTAQYNLPSIDGLRTKNELVQMAQRFEQMAQTVYEAADQAAAAGVGQPGATYVDAIEYRPSMPSPSLQLRPAHIESPMTSHSNHSGGTPVLTPPSSAGGYTSAHSPDSNHSNPRLSPATPNGSMYPTLPGPSVSAGYSSSSMAPTATLGAQSHNDYRPRHGGGYLQKAQPMGPPARHHDEMDTCDDASTPKESVSQNEPVRKAPVAPMQSKVDVLPSNIDPALSGGAPTATTPDPKSDDREVGETEVKRDARWVDTIRTLDVLKNYIQSRLANNDFETEGQADEKTKSEQEPGTPSLYPALPQQVEASG